MLCFSLNNLAWNSFCINTQRGASIFFTTVQYPMVGLSQNLFNQSPSEEDWVCFPSAAVINNAAVNKLIYTSFCSLGSISIKPIPGLGTLGRSVYAFVGRSVAKRPSAVCPDLKFNLKCLSGPLSPWQPLYLLAQRDGLRSQRSLEDPTPPPHWENKGVRKYKWRPHLPHYDGYDPRHQTVSGGCREFWTLCALLVETRNSAATVENSLVTSSKIKQKIALWFSNSTPRSISFKGLKTGIQTLVCQCSQQHYSQ